MTLREIPDPTQSVKNQACTDHENAILLCAVYKCMEYEGSRSFPFEGSMRLNGAETDLTTEKEVNSDSSVEEEVQLVQAKFYPARRHGCLILKKMNSSSSLYSLAHRMSNKEGWNVLL